MNYIEVYEIMSKTARGFSGNSRKVRPSVTVNDIRNNFHRPLGALSNSNPPKENYNNTRGDGVIWPDGKKSKTTEVIPQKTVPVPDKTAGGTASETKTGGRTGGAGGR